MENLFDAVKNSRRVALREVSHYVTERVPACEVVLGDYISTENMLPNKGGATSASTIPSGGSVTRYQSGDTLTSNIRPYFKKIWMATKNGGCSNDVLVVRSNNERELDKAFLYLALSKDTFFAHAMMGSRGTKMPRGDKDGIMEYEIPLPGLAIQKEIASILCTYDKKIENNNLITKNLEAIAQTIFDEWFVKFNFPGHEKVGLVEGEMRDTPEGWKVQNVLDVIERISVGKKYDNKSALPVGNIPILDQGKSGNIGYHNEDPGVIASVENPVVVFTNHTCYYRLMTEPFSCIQNVLPYKGKNGYPTLFVYFLTKEKIKMQEYKGHWPDFEQQNFIAPPALLAEKFAHKVSPLIEKMVACEKENNCLKHSRDQLLAKLI